MNNIVTIDMLEGLGNNVQVAFMFLHPDGLKIEELKKLANENAFYRGIYHHVGGVTK